MIKKNRFFLIIFLTLLGILYFDFFRGFDFSPIDEHILVGSILSGKIFPALYSPAGGRFSLAGFELNLLLPFQPTTANSFQFIAFIELAILSLFLFYFLELNRKKFLILFLGLFFVTAFQNSFIRLIGQERMCIVLLLIFFGFFLKKNKSSFEKVLMLFVGTLSLYYKETNFILIGVPAFVELIYKLRTKNKKIFDDLFLLVQCLVYLIFYWVVIKSHTTQVYHSELADSGHFDKVVKYCLNDPFLVLAPALLFLDFSWQRYKEIGIIIAITAFLFAYIALGLYSPYYMGPAYAALVLLLAQYDFKPRLKLALISSYVVLYLGAGLSTFTYFREMPRSMTRLIHKLGEAKPAEAMVVNFEKDNNNYEWVVAFETYYAYYNKLPIKLIFEDSNPAAQATIPRLLFPVQSHQHTFAEIEHGPAYLPDISPRSILKYLLIKKGHQNYKNYDVFQNPNYYLLD